MSLLLYCGTYWALGYKRALGSPYPTSTLTSCVHLVACSASAMSDDEKKDVNHDEVDRSEHAQNAPPLDEITAMNQRLANPLAVRPL